MSQNDNSELRNSFQLVFDCMSLLETYIFQNLSRALDSSLRNAVRPFVHRTLHTSTRSMALSNSVCLEVNDPVCHLLGHLSLLSIFCKLKNTESQSVSSV